MSETPDVAAVKAHILGSKDERYLEYCTDRQAEILKAVWAGDSINGAASALGLGRGTIRNTLVYIATKASGQGFAPDHGLTTPMAPGYVGRGHSNLYKVDRDTGEKRLVLQWEKTKADDLARQQAVEAAIAAACEAIPPAAPVAAPKQVNADLLNFLVFTDVHIGMRAWSEESGYDWDLEKVEDLLNRTFDHMILACPRAKVCFIAQLGDFLHFDGLLPLTPTSGHVLDSGATLKQMIRVAVRVLRRMVDVALQTHEQVVVLAAEGNHDMSSAPWLQTLLAALYENEPRVTVIDSPRPFYAYEWGRVMLAVHHGHMKKKVALPELFAAMFPEMWGRTTKRYAHAGHEHHEVVIKEYSGIRVIQHPTLAPNDSHSSRHGYVSERQTSAITYHRVFGKTGEIVVTPEMLAG